MTVVSLATPRTPSLYRFAQQAGLALTAALLVGLLAAPAQTLHVLWDMVIPLLPAVFLVNPLIWRNVCPLASLNSLAAKSRSTSARIEAGMLRASWGVGLLLLFVMVPARRFVFNTNGPILAATIVCVAMIAVTGGIVFARRGGFCNAICPVLPVEKLYGQAPLVRVGTARCGSCTVCTPVGCIELSADKATAQTLGAGRRDWQWILTPFGAFAAAFPGFIVGYFTTTNVSIDHAGGVYGHIALWTLGSYLAIALLRRLGGLGARVALPFLGALAIGLYYWFAAPSLATAYGFTEPDAIFLRMLALILIVFWGVIAAKRLTRNHLTKRAG